jgi:hypothetical protein
VITPNQGWLTQPWATVITAGFTILVAGAALWGVRLQVKSTATEGRLEDLWKRFTWVIEGGQAKNRGLNVSQMEKIMASVQKSAEKLGDDDLVAVVKEWQANLLNQAVGAAAEAVLTLQPPAKYPQPRSRDTSLDQVLMTADADDAARAAMSVARLVSADPSRTGDINENAKWILNLPEPERTLEKGFEELS